MLRNAVAGEWNQYEPGLCVNEEESFYMFDMKRKGQLPIVVSNHCAILLHNVWYGTEVVGRKNESEIVHAVLFLILIYEYNIHLI